MSLYLPVMNLVLTVKPDRDWRTRSWAGSVRTAPFGGGNGALTGEVAPEPLTPLLGGGENVGRFPAPQADRLRREVNWGFISEAQYKAYRAGSDGPFLFLLFCCRVAMDYNLQKPGKNEENLRYNKSGTNSCRDTG